jgi:hypothetical protein
MPTVPNQTELRADEVIVLSYCLVKLFYELHQTQHRQEIIALAERLVCEERTCPEA